MILYYVLYSEYLFSLVPCRQGRVMCILEGIQSGWNMRLRIKLVVVNALDNSVLACKAAYNLLSQMLQQLAMKSILLHSSELCAFLI